MRSTLCLPPRMEAVHGPAYLERSFTPRAIAVFGASDREDSVGGRVLRNILTAGFAGPVFPVNPRYESVAGRRLGFEAHPIPETPPFYAVHREL